MEYAKISQSLATTLASNQMKYFAVEGVLIWLNQNFGYVMEFVRAGMIPVIMEPVAASCQSSNLLLGLNLIIILTPIGSVQMRKSAFLLSTFATA